MLLQCTERKPFSLVKLLIDNDDEPWLVSSLMYIHTHVAVVSVQGGPF